MAGVHVATVEKSVKRSVEPIKTLQRDPDGNGRGKPVVASDSTLSKIKEHGQFLRRSQGARNEPSRTLTGMLSDDESDTNGAEPDTKAHKLPFWKALFSRSPDSAQKPPVVSQPVLEFLDPNSQRRQKLRQPLLSEVASKPAAVSEAPKSGVAKIAGLFLLASFVTVAMVSIAPVALVVAAVAAPFKREVAKAILKAPCSFYSKIAATMFPNQLPQDLQPEVPDPSIAPF